MARMNRLCWLLAAVICVSSACHVGSAGVSNDVDSVYVYDSHVIAWNRASILTTLTLTIRHWAPSVNAAAVDVNEDRTFSAQICAVDSTYICLISNYLIFHVPRNLTKEKLQWEASIDEDQWRVSKRQYYRTPKARSVNIFGQVVEVFYISSRDDKNAVEWNFLYSLERGLVGIQIITDPETIANSRTYFLTGRCGFGAPTSCHED